MKASFWWVAGVIAWFTLVPVDALGVMYARNTQALALSFGCVLTPLAARYFLRNAGTPALASFLILLGIGLSANFTREALFTSHSLTYWYGEHTNDEARQLIAKWRVQHPDGNIYVLARDMAFNNRAPHVIYASKSDMQERTQSICANPRAALIITRFRDDASLASATELQALSHCLKVSRREGDLMFGTNMVYE